MKAIEVQNLFRTFGRLRAVDGISFSVEAGELFGFLGPNGAGKTTTIRILTGQLRPTSGQAWVAGCNVVSEREALKPKIGVVFEYQNLYQRLDARDNLVFSAGLLLVGLSFVTDSQGSERIGYIIGGVMLVGLVMMYVLARNRQWALDVFHKLSARWSVLQRFGGSFLESFLNGLAVLTDGWLFLRFLFWMTLNWFVALVAYYLITLSFFPQAEFNWMYFVLGATAFGGAIPALPGAIGTFEGAVSAALTLFTKDQSTSLAVALTARLYNYLNSTVLGGMGLSREGQTLSGVYQQLMAFRKKEE